MPWPTTTLKRFSLPENEQLIQYLEHHSPSAHSDLGILLFNAVKHLPGAEVFGPNITACSYVFAHTKTGIAFAVAIGMRTLALRLPQPHPKTQPFTDISPDWHQFDPFNPTLKRDESQRLIDELFRAAYDWANTAQES
jgi:hypothetical protein